MENKDYDFTPEYAVNEFNRKNRTFPSVRFTSFFMLISLVSYFLVQEIMVLVLRHFDLVDTFYSNASFYYMFSAVFELIYIGIPFLAVMLYYKNDRIRLLRLNPLSVKEIIIMVALGLFAFLANIFLVQINTIVASFFSEVTIPETPTIVTTADKLIFMLALIVVAPITEELLMRGFIMRGLEGKSIKFAIVLAGVYFGMFHMSYDTIVPKVLAGILFCYVVYITDSLYAGIIMHMMNNGISGIIELMFTNQTAGDEVAQEFSTAELLSLLKSDVIWAAVMIAIIMSLLSALRNAARKTLEDGRRIGKANIREKLPCEEHIKWTSYIPVGIALAIMTAIMIMDCIS